MYERFVREIMSRDLVTCAATTTLEQIMRRLVDYAIHAIIVVDEDGYATGIVSQTDILLAQHQLATKGAQRLLARDIMSTSLITCTADATLLEAVTLMTRNHIHRLIVTKPSSGRVYPLGILSMTDIIRFVIKDTTTGASALRLQSA
ncbi:MAG: CBS domain-containing protein [Kouleothrix sp.]|jgi:CBS domain-containing protein|nr:CBS domain-containing protein [Kouleothrix sp.]